MVPDLSRAGRLGDPPGDERRPEPAAGNCREFIEDLTGHSTARSSANRLNGHRRRRMWYLVYKDDTGRRTRSRGATEGIRRSLKERLLGDASNDPRCRSKSGAVRGAADVSRVPRPGDYAGGGAAAEAAITTGPDGDSAVGPAGPESSAAGPAALQAGTTGLAAAIGPIPGGAGTHAAGRPPGSAGLASNRGAESNADPGRLAKTDCRRKTTAARLRHRAVGDGFGSFAGRGADRVQVLPAVVRAGRGGRNSGRPLVISDRAALAHGTRKKLPDRLEEFLLIRRRVPVSLQRDEELGLLRRPRTAVPLGGTGQHRRRYRASSKRGSAHGRSSLHFPSDCGRRYRAGLKGKRTCAMSGNEVNAPSRISRRAADRVASSTATAPPMDSPTRTISPAGTPSIVREPVRGGFAGRVAAGFARPAAGLPVAGIVVDQDSPA